MGEPIRIQKYLSQCGVASRRHAEELMRAGRVKKNGAVVRELGTQCDPENDAIEVDGKKVRPPQRHVYLMVNKPRGYVSTVRDRHAKKTVLELAPAELQSRLKPVGRLDKTSEGLILLTDDGPLILRLTHPRYHVEKEYRVGVSGKIDTRLPDALQAGVQLEEGVARANRAEIMRTKPNGVVLRMVLTQGWKRQIRRMIEAVGCKVDFLRRVRIGPIRLERLKRGECRHLTKAETDLLYSATGMTTKGERSRRGKRNVQRNR